MNQVGLEQAAELLKNGAVGVLPTDTVYGLVARAEDPASVARLYGLKGHENKPGTVVAASVAQLLSLGLNPRDLKEAASLWPNPISVILPAGPELAYLHMGVESLAVRVPKDPAIVELLFATGPLLTSSANVPGKRVAANLTEAYGYFGDKVDFYVDGGDFADRQPSAVVRLVRGQLEMVRRRAGIGDDPGPS